MSKTRGANYKVHEDKVLCQVWLSVSCDPIEGIYQTGDDLYGKIKTSFDDELRLRDTFIADRTAASLASRLLTISHAVSKFVACHTTVVVNCASGRTPLDAERDAVTLYEAKYSAFKYMQCWYVLRDSPKWGAWRSSNDKSKAPKKRQREVDTCEPDVTAPPQSDGALSPDSQHKSPSSTDVRPQGASKAEMERANLALYARQVKAAERSVANSEMRIKVAQDQLDLSLFSIPANPDDPLAAEFLLLKKKAALKRLRAELQVADASAAESNRIPATTGALQVVDARAPESNSTPFMTSDTPAQTSAVV